MAILNERIKSRRKLLNKTLLELAEYIGVKEATMQRYESGEIKSIPYDNIVLIAECLNCTPQYLMGWSECIKAEINFTPHEIDLITAYRNQPAMQEAVDRLLGVQKEGKVVVFQAARSTDNTPPGYTEVPKSVIEKLENAPDFKGDL